MKNLMFLSAIILLCVGLQTNAQAQTPVTNTSQLAALDFHLSNETDVFDGNNEYLYTLGEYSCWKTFHGDKCKNTGGVCGGAKLTYNKYSGAILTQNFSDSGGGFTDPSNLMWQNVEGEDEVYW